MTNCRTNGVTSTELSMRNSAKDQLFGVEKHRTEVTQTLPNGGLQFPLLWVVAILWSGLPEALGNGGVSHPDTQEKVGFWQWGYLLQQACLSFMCYVVRRPVI